MHVEGSVRAGEVTADYRSNDRDGLGKRGEYDTKNGYVGAHVGIGKTWTLTERDTFDVYTRGVWTRQGKDGTTLSTGERLEFDEIDSKRLQLGVRYEHTLNSGIQAKVSPSYASLGRCPTPRRGGCLPPAPAIKANLAEHPFQRGAPQIDARMSGCASLTQPTKTGSAGVSPAGCARCPHNPPTAGGTPALPEAKRR
jgi:hypothetical protein